MKKTKLRKGEIVSKRDNKNILLLAWHDKFVVVVSRYCRSVHSNLHLEVTQTVVKVLQRGTEISITNAYILYVEKWNKINSKPTSHTEFRKQLVMALVGDDSQDCAASTRR